MIEVLDAWAETGALDRARNRARELFAGLMPGQTGTRMADEIAEKIMAAAYPSQDDGPTANDASTN